MRLASLLVLPLAAACAGAPALPLLGDAAISARFSPPDAADVSWTCTADEAVVNVFTEDARQDLVIGCAGPEGHRVDIQVVRGEGRWRDRYTTVSPGLVDSGVVSGYPAPTPGQASRAQLTLNVKSGSVAGYGWAESPAGWLGARFDVEATVDDYVPIDTDGPTDTDWWGDTDR